MRKIVLFMLIVASMYAQKTTHYTVAGMHCPLCTTAVKKAVRKVDGVLKVTATLNTKEVVVTHEDFVEIGHILEAIKTTGYTGEFTKEANR